MIIKEITALVCIKEECKDSYCQEKCNYRATKRSLILYREIISAIAYSLYSLNFYIYLHFHHKIPDGSNMKNLYN